MRAYLNSEVINSPEQLKNIQASNAEISRLSGIAHNVDLIDVVDGQIALIWVDDALIESGEYHRKMTAMVDRSMGSIFSMLEEIIVEGQMNMPEGNAAARQTRDFFGMR